MVRTARSTATQAMTLEWVKCRRGPRTSQMPSSGSSQLSGDEVDQCDLQVPGRRAQRAPGPTRLVQRREHLAVDVELELARGGVADPHRGRLLVARQPADLPFVESALTGGPVHDLELGDIPGHGAQQPVAPRQGLFVESAAHERLEGEGGVAQPAVPVVPVALTTECLGQRRGGAQPRCRPWARR